MKSRYLKWVSTILAIVFVSFQASHADEVCDPGDPGIYIPYTDLFLGFYEVVRSKYTVSRFEGDRSPIPDKLILNSAYVDTECRDCNYGPNPGIDTTVYLVEAANGYVTYRGGYDSLEFDCYGHAEVFYNGFGDYYEPGDSEGGSNNEEPTQAEGIYETPNFEAIGWAQEFQVPRRYDIGIVHEDSSARPSIESYRIETPVGDTSPYPDHVILVSKYVSQRAENDYRICKEEMDRARSICDFLKPERKMVLNIEQPWGQGVSYSGANFRVLFYRDGVVELTNLKDGDRLYESE